MVLTFNIRCRYLDKKYAIFLLYTRRYIFETTLPNWYKRRGILNLLSTIQDDRL